MVNERGNRGSEGLGDSLQVTQPPGSAEGVGATSAPGFVKALLGLPGSEWQHLDVCVCSMHGCSAEPAHVHTNTLRCAIPFLGTSQQWPRQASA